ncbi:MAG TPA: preprotein translocase subunit Sec61beta [Candidatus Nanoarchaeia archaeon]|nr:preprotein translocase subunit Sec61beta [Candidatus Nanoarchaeia archaeon]
MANNNIQLPSSGGGIMRYNDEVKSKIMLKPQHVMVLIAVVLILELILHIYGNSMFGLV